jgi:hypothetical protein
MKIVTDQIPLSELKQMSEKGFGNLVKAVIDMGAINIIRPIVCGKTTFMLLAGRQGIL